MPDFGPSGYDVYSRTYSRTKPDGTKEDWPETVERVVDGNLGLVDAKYRHADERDKLIEYMSEFKILPAGRHLWASGVKGRQYLMNCWVSGWTENPSEHFAFSFLRLMEGGGVGANYSNRFLAQYPPINNSLEVHIVCDPEHSNYADMREAGLLSSEYDSDWPGAFEVQDSREGWAAALTDLIETFYRPAKNHKRVYDVSRVRQAGARLKQFGGYASGPAPLARMLIEVSEVMSFMVGLKLTGMDAMEIDHAIAQCVVAGGNRRSARMSIMRWDDKQIGEFLSCKQDTGTHWTTNISVEVDDRFFADLADGGSVASRVLRSIAEGMLANGEPGMWNSSLSNFGEPNDVISTNPCGEIALQAWEPCNLGHVNLGAFVQENGKFDYLGALTAHMLMTRFLIRATYGDVNAESSREVLTRNRRIGVGHFGFAHYLALRGIRYSDAPNSKEVQNMLTEMAAMVDKEAHAYSHELRIPVPVKRRTVAPTGTIAKMPGTSEGIHPIFAKHFIRRIRFSDLDPDQVRQVENYRQLGFHTEPCQYAASTTVVEIPTKDLLYARAEAMLGKDTADKVVQAAGDLTLEQMLAVQMLYQDLWADNAVSYTANVDPEKYTVDQVAWVLGYFGPYLKGSTVFPEVSRPQSPYEAISEAEYELAQYTMISDSVDEECASGSCPVR